MTDTVKLEKAIADSGLKKARIAGELNITYQTLKRKINNEVPFNAGEISKMCDLLRISNLNDKEAIFFARDVDK
ncbi:helix-turn-helix domain-containing protein [Agathobacter sp.]